MCALVIGLYFAQQENARNSLVSPKAVLEVRDNLEVFEMREKELINSSLGSVEGFGSEGFKESFRSKFLSEFYSDEIMTEFVLGSLVLEGREIESDARAKSSLFFNNTLYPEELTYYDGGKLVFERAPVGKSINLNADRGNEKISFPVKFKFNFDKKYIISKKGNEFVVEEG
jgi:hypothetical protein